MVAGATLRGGSGGNGPASVTAGRRPGPLKNRSAALVVFLLGGSERLGPREASPSPVYGAALLMRFGLIPIPGSNPGASAHDN